jgi:hypothetical protein
MQTIISTACNAILPSLVHRFHVYLEQSCSKIFHLALVDSQAHETIDKSLKRKVHGHSSFQAGYPTTLIYVASDRITHIFVSNGKIRIRGRVFCQDKSALEHA